jgi:phenylpropionate dioxygenase-like ring-hydroxylating dioxygenase large terminal subunit
LLFATFDPEASPLCEYLGEMTWYLDAFFYRREGGIEVISAHKWLVPCNWKFPTENFGGDLYHVQWSHLSAIETAFSSGVSTKPDTTGSEAWSAISAADHAGSTCCLSRWSGRQSRRGSRRPAGWADSKQKLSRFRAGNRAMVCKINCRERGGTISAGRPASLNQVQ